MRFIAGLAVAATMTLCLSLGSAHADRRVAAVTGKNTHTNLPGDRQIKTAESLKADEHFQPTSLQGHAVLLLEEVRAPVIRVEGTVSWRFDPSKGTKGAVYAVVDFPQRALKMQITFEPNTDQSLRASHTAEVNFITEADSPGGGVETMANIVMKASEDEVGAPSLSGSVVPVTNGVFLVGLTESMRVGNLQLLKNRSWFEIPVTFATRHRRALIAFEKGASGEHALNEAFSEWGD